MLLHIFVPEKVSPESKYRNNWLDHSLKRSDITWEKGNARAWHPHFHSVGLNQSADLDSISAYIRTLNFDT